MATNLHIDDGLIAKTMELGGHRTKKAAVTRALTDYIEHLEQLKIIDLFDAIEYDPDYDYKQSRT